MDLPMAMVAAAKEAAVVAVRLTVIVRDSGNRGL